MIGVRATSSRPQTQKALYLPVVIASWICVVCSLRVVVAVEGVELDAQLRGLLLRALHDAIPYGLGL